MLTYSADILKTLINKAFIGIINKKRDGNLSGILKARELFYATHFPSPYIMTIAFEKGFGEFRASRQLDRGLKIC